MRLEAINVSENNIPGKSGRANWTKEIGTQICGPYWWSYLLLLLLLFCCCFVVCCVFALSQPAGLESIKMNDLSGTSQLSWHVCEVAESASSQLATVRVTHSLQRQRFLLKRNRLIFEMEGINDARMATAMSSSSLLLLWLLLLLLASINDGDDVRFNNNRRRHRRRYSSSSESPEWNVRAMPASRPASPNRPLSQRNPRKWQEQ